MAQSIYQIQSSKNKNTLYRVSHHKNHWSCDCLAWKKQFSPLTKRTCKHIIQINGKEREKNRAPDSYHGLTRMNPQKRHINQFKPMLYQQLQQDNSIPILTSSNWYWSRKHDGIYARWEKGTLWSKTGRSIIIPPNWKSVLCMLPSHLIIEGEIVSNRLKRSDAFQILHDKDYEKEHWIPLRFMIFDVVDRKKTFEQRLNIINMIREQLPICKLKVVTYHTITPNNAISEWKKQMTYCKQHKLEGIVLRHPKGMYESGKRTKTTLKSKPIEHGTGKIISPGVIEEDNTKQQFKMVQAIWPIGTAVTFNYSGRTETGKPEFPRSVLKL